MGEQSITMARTFFRIFVILSARLARKSPRFAPKSELF
jgi:hypothetical protein